MEEKAKWNRKSDHKWENIFDLIDAICFFYLIWSRVPKFGFVMEQNGQSSTNGLVQKFGGPKIVMFMGEMMVNDGMAKGHSGWLFLAKHISCLTKKMKLRGIYSFFVRAVCFNDAKWRKSPRNICGSAITISNPRDVGHFQRSSHPGSWNPHCCLQQKSPFCWFNMDKPIILAAEITEIPPFPTIFHRNPDLCAGAQPGEEVGAQQRPQELRNDPTTTVLPDDHVTMVGLGIFHDRNGKSYTEWCPPVISWFINPMNTIVISAINHSYKPT